MKLLRLDHVEKSSDGLGVIRGVFLSVEEGEIVSVIGPSDSGRSTLLRYAAMLETMGSGEVIYLGKRAAWTEDGKVVHASKKNLKEIQSQYGPVFQSFNLFPHCSVMKNIMDAPIHMQRRDKAQIYEKIRILLRKMGLEDERKAFLRQLSDSQCQRVAIARALVLNPKTLFFDEPTSALGPGLTEEILKVIKPLADLDIVIVIVTYEMAFAGDISDRVVFMAGGVTVEEGTPEQVFASGNGGT